MPQLIESLRQGGSKVFVHCMTGRSKSVVAVAAYLVAAFGVTPSVAVEEIKRAHPATNVTEEHQQLLAEFSAAWAQSPKFPPINGVA